MPTIEVSDEMYRRVEEFTKVVCAVLDENADAATAFGIVLERGLKTALGDIIAHQEESTLLESFHQIAARHPEVVYPYVADMVGLGADLRELRSRQTRIGFRTSSRRKP